MFGKYLNKEVNNMSEDKELQDCQDEDCGCDSGCGCVCG